MPPIEVFLLGEDHRFPRLLALSACLHGLVLWGLGGPPPVSRPMPPRLEAELRLRVAPSEAPVIGVSSEQARPAPVKPREEGQKTASMLASPVAGFKPTAAPEPQVAMTANPAPAEAPRDGVVAELPPAPRPAADLDRLLDGYGRRLSDLLARHYTYPRVAEMRGWEGEVQLRLRVARKGGLLGVSVERSSGFEVLDQHARAMVEQLRVFPPPPDELESGEIQVVIPVSYRLKRPA